MLNSAHINELYYQYHSGSVSDQSKVLNTYLTHIMPTLKIKAKVLNVNDTASLFSQLVQTAWTVFIKPCPCMFIKYLQGSLKITIKDYYVKDKLTKRRLRAQTLEQLNNNRLARIKASNSMKAWWKNHPENYKVYSDRARQFRHTEETKKHMSMRQKAIPHKPFSQETKNKISLSLKASYKSRGGGRPLTPEHKKKISDRCKGRISGNKGHHLSQTAKDTISKSLRRFTKEQISLHMQLQRKRWNNLHKDYTRYVQRLRRKGVSIVDVLVNFDRTPE
jgi:hypothetical protein